MVSPHVTTDNQLSPLANNIAVDMSDRHPVLARRRKCTHILLVTVPLHRTKPVVNQDASGSSLPEIEMADGAQWLVNLQIQLARSVPRKCDDEISLASRRNSLLHLHGT